MAKKKFTVNYHMTYQVEADNKDDAIHEADKLLLEDFPSLSDSDSGRFGWKVEENE